MMRVPTACMVLTIAACGGSKPASDTPANRARSAPRRSHTDAPVLLAAKRSQPRLLHGDASGLYWSETDDDGVTTVWFISTATPNATPVAAWKPAGELGPLTGDDESLYALLRGDDATSRVVRRAKNGGPETMLASDAGVDVFDLVGATLFWGGGRGEVYSLELAGTHKPTKLVENVEYSYMDNLAAGAHFVYFSNSLDDTPRRIYRVPRAGGDAEQVDVPGIVDAWTLAGDSLYVSYEPDDKLVVLAEADPSKSTPMAGTGRPLGVIGDQLVLLVGESDIVMRSIKTGAATNVPMPEAAWPPAVEDGALWFVMPHAGVADDETSYDVMMYVP